MPTIHTTRQASTDEIADEMDRRGAAIVALEAKVSRYEDALQSIDAVAVDFGHYEAAARTMKELAEKALAAA